MARPRPDQSPQQAAEIVRLAVLDALRDIKGEHHLMACGLFFEEGLKGLAHQRGLRAAAETAYRLADKLAEGVR